jgi:hypothetical protein
MPRPRKSDADRMVVLSTYVPPARFDEIERMARARGMSLAAFVRQLLLKRVSQVENPSPSASS